MTSKASETNILWSDHFYISPLVVKADETQSGAAMGIDIITVSPKVPVSVCSDNETQPQRF